MRPNERSQILKNLNTMRDVGQKILTTIEEYYKKHIEDYFFPGDFTKISDLSAKIIYVTKEFKIDVFIPAINKGVIFISVPEKGYERRDLNYQRWKYIETCRISFDSLGNIKINDINCSLIDDEFIELLLSELDKNLA